MCTYAIKLLKVYENKEYLCLLLELIEGVNLHELIRSQKYLNEDDSKIIAAQILLSVDYFHQRGIIHRDLKPSNILIFNSSTTQKEVKIADFGFAKDLNEEELDKVQLVCGRIGYHAPDVLKLEKQSLKSDMFSIGVVLYNMISGKHLFDGKNQEEIIVRN